MKITVARRVSFEVAHLCFRSRIRENSGRVLIAKRLNSHEFSYISQYSATSKRARNSGSRRMP